MLTRARLYSKKLILFFVVLGTAIATFVAYAAFIEPTLGPSSSSQDFSQNILGANNSNNAFDSTNVSPSSNGSIIERLEYIQDQLQ